MIAKAFSLAQSLLWLTRSPVLLAPRQYNRFKVFYCTATALLLTLPCNLSIFILELHYGSSPARAVCFHGWETARIKHLEQGNGREDVFLERGGFRRVRKNHSEKHGQVCP